MNITYHGIEAHDSPTFDMSVNFYPAAEFIHKALTAGGRCRFCSCTNSFLLRCLDRHWCFVCREGAGPLHGGSEPLSHTGAGLPDDPTEPDAGGGHQDGEGPSRRHPQPRLPASAQRPGRDPEGESSDVGVELKQNGTRPGSVRFPQNQDTSGHSTETESVLWFRIKQVKFFHFITVRFSITPTSGLQTLIESISLILQAALPSGRC